MNRYSSAALTGDFGALETVSPTKFQNYKSFGAAAEHDDGQIVYLGGNYSTAASPRPSSWASTSRASRPVSSPPLLKPTPHASTPLATGPYSADGVKGYGLHLGTIVPVAGGDLTVAAYFTDFAVEYADHDV